MATYKIKMADNQQMQPKLKLSDEEKSKLICFYKDHKELWSSSINFRSKEEKSELKEELINLFEGSFTEDFLDKNFHALRTAFNRESKKYKDKEPKKKWKFFDQLSFLAEETERVEKKTPFELEEKETLIDFFSANPALWNQHLNEYRDRNLRDSLFEKLVEQFEGKFTKDDLKREWHNLQTMYKRERAREEGSKSSGSGSFEVYVSSWELFGQMEFLDVTGDVDVSYTSLDGEGASQPPKKRQKKTRQTIEDDSKAELWKSLAASLKPQETETSKDEISERASLFGKVVADSLAQYDTSEWSYLKKKVMDVFFDFDQQKSNNSRLNIQSPTFQQNQFQGRQQFVPGQYLNMVNNPLANFDAFSPASTSSQGSSKSDF